MGLYNVMFGHNDRAALVLKTLGLTLSDVGRFRDAGIADGRLYVYTRNGGGNRKCWCADSPKWGTPGCRHEKLVEEVPEVVTVTPEEAAEKGYQLLNVFVGGKRQARTGRTVLETRYVCQQPDSPDCRCVGCFMTYHVHKLPHYSHDRDDEFDSTYATIWFDFPPEYADALRAMDTGETWDPDERWLTLIDSLRGAQEPEAPSTAPSGASSPGSREGRQ